MESLNANGTCPKCGRDRTIDPATGKPKERHKATGKAPSVATMMKWSDNGIAKATDGCKVEPDGTCPHGHTSWMRIVGVI